MKTATLTIMGCFALVGLASAGCAGTPDPPFNTLEDSNVTAFRLQNYEPPAPAPGVGPGAAGIPGLPPELNAWIQQGAQGLTQLIPPGLLPPGLLPGAGTGPAPAPATDTTPRFHTFRILNQQAVIDPELKEDLADILGDEDNFQAEHASCGYAEVGISFQPPSAGQPNDLLISFSCNKVMPQRFAWPHPHIGLKPKTVQKLAEVINKLWPPGT
jgi:hypothetical protein